MNFSKLSLRRRLISAPLQDGDPLYEELRGMGFPVDGSWVVNPYWSACGEFQVEDPAEAYGEKFLLSPIANLLGTKGITKSNLPT